MESFLSNHIRSPNALQLNQTGTIVNVEIESNGVPYLRFSSLLIHLDIPKLPLGTSQKRTAKVKPQKENKHAWWAGCPAAGQVRTTVPAVTGLLCFLLGRNSAVMVRAYVTDTQTCDTWTWFVWKPEQLNNYSTRFMVLGHVCVMHWGSLTNISIVVLSK